MPGSNLSVVNALDGTTRVAISTPSNDANGNTVVGHLAMVAVAGIATPVSALAPVPVGAGSGPLLDASAAVGTTAVVLLAAPAAGTARRHVEVQNVGPTTIGLNFGAAPTIGLGSIVLAPFGSMRFATPAFIPADVLNAISSAAGGAVTVKWA